jgi:hypothetical protein
MAEKKGEKRLTNQLYPSLRAVFVWASQALEMYEVYMNECRIASSTCAPNFGICSLPGLRLCQFELSGILKSAV